MSNENKKQEKTRVSFKQIMLKEYPAEKYVILLLGFAFILLAAWFLMGRIVVDENINWFGKYTTNVFIVVIMALGFSAIIIGLWAQILSSSKEVRKVTPPTSKVMAELTVKVFIFIVVMAFIIFLMDNGFSNLITWLKDIANN